MADRKAFVDGTMSALGLVTAAAIVFLAPMTVTSDEAAGQNEYVASSGSWTDLEQGSAMTDQRVESQANSESARH